MAKVGRPKTIETPERMMELFNEYRQWVKSDPILVHDFVGKDGEEVFRKKEKPLTFEGFEVYLYEKGICDGVEHYFRNQGGLYTEYIGICSHIKKMIRMDQIAGGMAGIYNPSITQRLNNLKEAQDITTDGKIEVVFVDGKTVL